MAIYGTAILALCAIAGLLGGRLLGDFLGLDANVGGVGIAMVLLILTADRLRRAGRFSPPTQSGILYWNAIYVPIVVAIAATQNVRAAIHSGPMAILAGAAAVAACIALVPLVSRIGAPPPKEDA